MWTYTKVWNKLKWQGKSKKMKLKWNLPLKAGLFIFHYICYYEFVSMYFFARNDRWLPTQLLTPRQLHFANKLLILIP